MAWWVIKLVSIHRAVVKARIVVCFERGSDLPGLAVAVATMTISRRHVCVSCRARACPRNQK